MNDEIYETEETEVGDVYLFVPDGKLIVFGAAVIAGLAVAGVMGAKKFIQKKLKKEDDCVELEVEEAVEDETEEE